MRSFIYIRINTGKRKKGSKKEQSFGISFGLHKKVIRIIIVSLTQLKQNKENLLANAS